MINVAAEVRRSVSGLALVAQGGCILQKLKGGVRCKDGEPPKSISFILFRLQMFVQNFKTNLTPDPNPTETYDRLIFPSPDNQPCKQHMPLQHNWLFLIDLATANHYLHLLHHHHQPPWANLQADVCLVSG